MTRVHALVAATAAAAVVAVAALASTADGAVGPLTVLGALTLALVIAKLFPFVIVHKGQAAELTFEEVVLAVMFVLLPPVGVLVGVLASTAIAQGARVRSPIKAVHNHASQGLALSAGLAVQALVGGGPAGTVTARSLLAAGLGVFTFSVVLTVLVWSVIATATGSRLRDVARSSLGLDTLSCTVAVTWGLVAVAVVPSSLFVVLVCIVPVVMLRQLQHQRRQRHHLELLLRTANSISSTMGRQSVERAVLDATRQVVGGAEAALRPEPPRRGELGAVVRTPKGDRWLVVRGGHGRDPLRGGAQALLEGLAAIGSTALENASLVDRVGRDPVTDLPAGALFTERLALTLDGVDGSRPAAVIVVTVDRLDVIKDSLGPAAADVVLGEIGRRLGRIVAREPDVVARPASVGYLGDGEFAVVVPGVDDPDEILPFALAVEKVVRRSVPVADIEVGLEVSTGIALTRTGPSASTVQDALSTAARIARIGGRRIQIAGTDDAPAGASRLTIESDLRAALQRGELSVRYQPVVELDAGRTVGAEALVRWEHPEHGMISPADFVPLAEETGLVVDLDRLVLDRVCRQIARWDLAGLLPEGFAVSVNLSAPHIDEPDVVGFIERLLVRTGVDPVRLCLELTESAVMRDMVGAAATVRALRRLGLRMAIDDFGTGYSSLLYLRHFAVDTLKIDRSFVDGMATEPGDATIVAGTIGLAHALGLRVVAEGVETDEQLERLRYLGCDTAQGFWWSPAVPSQEFAATWLRGQSQTTRDPVRALGAATSA
jgi:diguanylate cyclase (GGDEF)-like protein